MLVGLLAANVAANSASRNAVELRQDASTDTAKQARHHRVHARVRHTKVLRHADRSRASVYKTSVRRTKTRVSVFSAGRPVQQRSGIYRLGRPYVMGGRTFTPRLDPNYRAEGKASWYGSGFHGQLTANGEKFDMNALSAAHPTLPLPSYVRVTNLENQRTLIVRVNDRGPYRGNRLIDVSVRAARLLGFEDQGLAQVRVEYIGIAERTGSGNIKIASSSRR
jgi:rare lipoprotein A (peptidoglycan hydrolase)